MIIRELKLCNFRNYKLLDCRFSQGINVFYGKNGQGKTNVLEAIYFSALGSSHRTKQENYLINKDADNMSLTVTFENSHLFKEIKIKKKGRTTAKEILLDKIQIKPRELVGELKITMFSPEDLQLIKAEPALRRRFLDIQLSQINSLYCLTLNRYNQVLKQRNILLKQIKEKKNKTTNLEIWDEQLAKYAGYLCKKRVDLLTKISFLIKKNYASISRQNEDVECLYLRKENSGENTISTVENDLSNWYKKQLFQRREKDIYQAATGIGPHRDDILFTIDKMAARAFASQGQQRSLVLALKIAEIEIIKEESGEYPVLLLDDVMSELDMDRKNNLLLFLDGKVQTFITLTEKEIIQNFPEAEFYYVEYGNIFKDKL